ncbi:hypothetical protein Q8A67_009598 [Cirrhinus molitorella]|uniref:Uncharacterized protein n=1 Tax=Cirrhinus molitorella TaxID=172907 RepID=A0AA88PZL9_9TELE|nr:hypothetical protein Q8A67_009598 [Cirrhinus molitorella]
MGGERALWCCSSGLPKNPEVTSLCPPNLIQTISPELEEVKEIMKLHQQDQQDKSCCISSSSTQPDLVDLGLGDIAKSQETGTTSCQIHPDLNQSSNGSWIEVETQVLALLPLSPPPPQKPQRSFQKLCWRLGTLQELMHGAWEGKGLCGVAVVAFRQTRRLLHCTHST